MGLVTDVKQQMRELNALRISYRTSRKTGGIPTLKGTNWASDFYHYHRNYFFETDSTGYFEHGQLAWSLPIDTVALKISGNQILYEEPESFKYSITDTTLTIEYFKKDSAGLASRQVFYLEKRDNNRYVWRANQEFTYGREYLFLENRVEIFEPLDKF